MGRPSLPFILICLGARAATDWRRPCSEGGRGEAKGGGGGGARDFCQSRKWVRPRPKPLGDKDLAGFTPLPPPADPLKERGKKEVEVVLKKPKKRRAAIEGEKSTPVVKKMKVGSEDVPMVEKVNEGRVGAAPEEEIDPATKEDKGPSAQVAKEDKGPSAQVLKEHVRPSAQTVVAVHVLEVTSSPMGGKTGASTPRTGAALTTALYHVRAFAGRSVEEEGKAKAAADRLVGVLEDVAMRSMARLREVDLLRGLSSAQMEAATLAAALLNKSAHVKMEIEPLRVQLEGVKRQLQKLMEEIVGWKKAAQSAGTKALKRAQRAKKIKVLAVVQGHATDRVGAELLATRSELEAERRMVVLLEFQLAKLEKALADERAKSASERAKLEKALAEERAKSAFERAAYPDLCIAAIEQFKGSADFQIAIDAAVASSLAKDGEGGAGPSDPPG
ncbi:hypothetical protein CsSME_00012607 [Camellia sinensis var. sinensis]